MRIHRGRNVLSWLLAAGVLAHGSAALGQAAPINTQAARAIAAAAVNIPQRKIPRVVGHELGDAQDELKAAGFTPQPIPLDPNAPVKAGASRRIVVRTIPAADTKLAVVAGKPLVVKVFHVAEKLPDLPKPPVPNNDGPAYTVPPVIGKTCGDAAARVGAAKLRFSCRTPAGLTPSAEALITSQSPTAGARFPTRVLVEATVAPVTPTPRPRPEVEVPPLQDLTETAALDRLRALGLRGLSGGAPAAEGRRVGTQSPSAGTRVTPGTEVRMRLVLTVPALAGLDCAAARERAAAHGLPELRCEWQRARPDAPLRRVFEQAPAAATRLALPEAMRVVLAQPVTVPDVRGLALDSAQERLKSAGLEGLPDATGGDRSVRTQQPGAGTEVAPASTIRLTTLRHTIVPAVVGQSVPDARRRIEQARLRPVFDALDSPDRRVVNLQVPDAGSRLADGGAVTLKTRLMAKVPDVVGKRLAAASVTLTEVGLEARPDHDDHPADREVRGQTPVAGQRVAAGGAVALVTVRKVLVPEVLGRSCADAQKAASAAGLAPQRCSLRGAWPIVIGQPDVTSQSPAAGGEVDEGTPMVMEAVVPWQPTAVTLGVGAGFSFAAGAWVVRRRRDRSGRRDAGTCAAALSVNWRVEPDLHPLVELRSVAPIDNDARDPTQWRVVEGVAQVHLRGLEHSRESIEEGTP